MNSNSRGSIILAALIGALLVAIPMIALAIGGVFDSSDDSAPKALASEPSEIQSDPPSAAPARSATDVSDLYERVRPGVVSIEARSSVPTQGSTGTGFVLDREGYILTNDHVVDGAATLRVRFVKGGPVKARLVGADPSSDLALLKVEPSEENLKPLPLGSSSSLKVGQPAVAIGSPFGLEGTLTTGVVSAVQRSITAPNNFSIDNVVQTDAAINPGNSGGPLLDASGRVVGVNAQIATTTQANSGVGFAIPINTAKQIVPDLKAGREIKRPYVGVETANATTGTGASIRKVVPGGPADDAGLRPADVITRVDDKAVDKSADVSLAISDHKPGDSVGVRIRRGDSERTITVKLGTRPKTAR
jgi:S1-C subfamily serine protease